MDTTARSKVCSFVRNVAQFGTQISHVLHEYTSLENHVNSNVSTLLANLNATIYSLNQSCVLLSLQEQPRSLLNDEGLKYMETLAEECSVAIGHVMGGIAGNNCNGNLLYSPKYWESPVTIDEEGHRMLKVPDLDEVALFRDMKTESGSMLLSALGNGSQRLNRLQLLLLLVVQVMIVQDMTHKLRSGAMNLADIVEYHARIVRAAKKARLASDDGRACNTRTCPPSYYPSVSSGSDSDVSVKIKRSPLPLSIKNSKSPKAPGGWIGRRPDRRLSLPSRETTTAFAKPGIPYPPTEGTSVFPSRTMSQSSPVITKEEGENCKSINNPLPPSYSEKDRVVEFTAIQSEIPPSVQSSPPEDLKLEHVRIPDQMQVERSANTSYLSKNLEPSMNDNAHLFNSTASGLGMKLRNIFRSRTSLEAEMKRKLADTNASLTAFIVQHKELRRVPHSAFHSLEYTHMRTILSQLKDDTWFRTFLDLTDAEHETMDLLLRKFLKDGKWFQRDLIVLKIMQQSRFNKWKRIADDCTGFEDCTPPFKNYRIILAIVREKQCDPDNIIPSPQTDRKANGIDCYHPPQVPRIPSPFPGMQDDKLLVDLDNLNPPTVVSHSGAPLGGPTPKLPLTSFNRGSTALPHPRPGWIRPLPALVPSSCSGPLSPTSNVDMGYTEVIPQNAISNESAREALTSYEAYTLRPALPQQSALAPLRSLPQSTWSRCFLTRECEETRVLLQRIQQFRLRGVSIIDLKLQLTQPQAAQLTHLIQRLNQMERDNRFEHKVVELSMVDREHGIVVKQTTGTKIDVIHVTVQRALKQGVNTLLTYNALIRRAPPPRAPPPPTWSVPPPPGPPPPPNKVKKDIFIMEDTAKLRANGRKTDRKAWGAIGTGSRPRELSSDGDSDSDSSDFTVTTCSSDGSPGCSLISDNSDSGSETLPEARWVVDPVAIRLGPRETGRDIVQLLLERWTPVGDGKVMDKDKEEEVVVEEAGRARRRPRRATVEEDSLADD